MSTPTDWGDILDQDEVIRWQGRPDPTVAWMWPHYISLALGLAVCVFALLWMLAATQDGGWFWTFGLLFLCIGIGIAFAPPHWRPYIRRKSWYTLTNKRALIATDLPILGRKVKSYPITPQAPLELEPRYKSGVYFATRAQRSRNGPYKIKIGFERIEDADYVLNLMREIQKENT